MSQLDDKNRGRMIETRVLVMTPGEPNARHTVDLPAQPTYDELAEVMKRFGVENCEHVTVLSDFTGGVKYRRADMFVDEHGQAKGLPRNEFATAIYRRNAILRQGAIQPETLPWIAGVAVLFERIVWT
jgi:hypothetical protein